MNMQSCIAGTIPVLGGSFVCFRREKTRLRAPRHLKRSSHVQDVQYSHHASESWALELIVERKEYDEFHGLRPKYWSRYAGGEGA